MAEPDPQRAVDLGIYARPAPAAPRGGADRLALAVALAWLAGSALFFLTFGRGEGAAAGDPLRLAVTLLAVVLPAALVWAGAAACRSARVMREESARLHQALDALRPVLPPRTGAPGPSGDPAQATGAGVARPKSTEIALSTFTSIRPQAPGGVAPLPAPRTAEQASLALGPGSEAMAPPLDNADFIQALQFPDHPDDREGFRALRRALHDRPAAQLITAAQDVLTLLAQDGIYVDDLSADRARPEVWRRFAQGERGAAVAGLGGIRDRSSLALSAARMRSDTIFRDAVHHFLRKFDHGFAAFEPLANDAEVIALTETRTAKAFILLGRAAGTFD